MYWHTALSVHYHIFHQSCIWKEIVLLTVHVLYAFPLCYCLFTNIVYKKDSRSSDNCCPGKVGACSFVYRSPGSQCTIVKLSRDYILSILYYRCYEHSLRYTLIAPFLFSDIILMLCTRLLIIQLRRSLFRCIWSLTPSFDYYLFRGSNRQVRLLRTTKVRSVPLDPVTSPLHPPTSVL